MAEGRAHQVFNGLIPVGHGRDNEGILAAGLGEQTQVRSPVLEETRGLDAASQDDRCRTGVGDERLAHGVIRAGQKLQDGLRYTCCPQGLHDLPTDQHCFGGRFENDRVARHQRREYTTERDGQRKVPGGCYHHDTQRCHHTVSHVFPQVQGLGIVAGEVDGFRDLGVSLGDGLRTVKHHTPNEVPTAACQLSGDFQQHGLSHGYRARAPRRLRLYGYVQCPIHMGSVSEGIAVGNLVWPGGINTLGMLWTVDELAAYLQWDGLQWHLPPALYYRLDPGLIRRQGPVGVWLIVKGLVVPSHWLLRAAVLSTARSVRHDVLPLAGCQEAVALALPRLTVRLHTEEIMEEVLRRGIFVQAAHQIGNGAVEILGLDHWRIE